MTRIDKNQKRDKRLERRHTEQMVRHITEYELVKAKSHPTFKTAEAFYNARGLCRQNFSKYYRRYVQSGRKLDVLLPRKAGRQYRELLTYDRTLLEKIKTIRDKGYNKFDIALLLKKEIPILLSASTVYRLMKKLGLNRLNMTLKEEKRRIIKMNAGELGHIDIHYVSKGTVREVGNKPLYLLGLMDDYSRIVSLEVLGSLHSIEVMFASLELCLRLKERYAIQFTAILSDNGSEFASKKNPRHPFERLLQFYQIKHYYTQPYRPQTNGKIERFWETLENELLIGETFDTLQEFKEMLFGYTLYYNEHRSHQGLSNRTPLETITNNTPTNSVNLSKESSKLASSLHDHLSIK
jgi:transposase InsO family protein